MIQEFVTKFDAAREQLLETFTITPPTSYSDIVGAVIRIVGEGVEYGGPDPERITLIDHGDYQGTLVFVIGAKGYQPSMYWYVYVYYGSCSGCDTFQAISDSWENTSADKKAAEYLTLALHILQGLKVMD